MLTETKAAVKTSVRQQEIITAYLALLDAHIGELKAGTAEETLEIKHFAAMLHIHPRHLSNTIHTVLQRSPCSLYEERLLAVAKDLVLSSQQPIAQVARHLMYDPSNFSKFFKSFTGLTPAQYRQAHTKK